MMNPSEEHIKEIAELLDCGELCFFHKPTGTIEHHPDQHSEYFDPEPWQETMDRIDADWGNYKRFEKMDSRQGFRVMEDFANSLTDNNFRTTLLELLSEHKPFNKFKLTIENSNNRENWFEFKQQANIDWVREQLN